VSHRKRRRHFASHHNNEEILSHLYDMTPVFAAAIQGRNHHRITRSR